VGEFAPLGRHRIADAVVDASRLPLGDVEEDRVDKQESAGGGIALDAAAKSAFGLIVAGLPRFDLPGIWLQNAGKKKAPLVGAGP